ncbi:hypothetical protein MUN82_05365 [Hymenobacter aerilatus]|uniref:Uncharacterized protein n=1 Tax=Hymenobacter aerilatus TaxID=2932251 RepID=A0A8T9T0M7_9BACT|nr:hypothetical protein [Hymenobacter aerilatus]UOR06523.1 hypothetical protein MUN82_05365 [Hymenobacter aerilatus]
MKQNLLLFSGALLLILGACKQQPTATITAAVPAEAVATIAAPELDTMHVAAAQSRTPEMREFLAKHDVASLLQKEEDSHEVMNGFYGPDHYRVEFAMLSVVRDTKNPDLLHVRGKDRFKGAVTPFEGEIYLTKLQAQPLLTAEELAAIHEHGFDWENDPSAQSILGTFTLREDSNLKGAGVITGEVAIDFRKDENGQLILSAQGTHSPSEQGNVKFEGIWTSNTTHKKQPVVWVSNIFSYGPQIFKEFVIGERDPDFNPKYAKLGWDTYWENDEWWAEPGTTITAQMNP